MTMLPDVAHRYLNPGPLTTAGELTLMARDLVVGAGLGTPMEAQDLDLDTLCELAYAVAVAEEVE